MSKKQTNQAPLDPGMNATPINPLAKQDQMHYAARTHNAASTEEQNVLTQFIHERFFTSLQYVQFIAQRNDQAIQAYLTILTASAGGLVILVASDTGHSQTSLWAAIAAVIFVMGVAGIITALRIVDFRRMRDHELYRLYHLQQYFREIDPEAFDEYHTGFRRKSKKPHYWFVPLVRGFGLFHAILPSIAISIFVWLAVSSVGYSTSQSIIWILLLGIILSAASAYLYYRLHQGRGA